MYKKIILIVFILLVIAGGTMLFMVKDRKLISSQNNDNKQDVNLKKDNISRIKMIINNKEYFIKLISNESSKDLISLLPLEVEFEDYNNTEKIASLPKKLKLENNPGEYEVKIGDFAYYAPWGNLSIFYKEFHSSNSLQKLGEFENGIEDLKNLKGKAVITFDEEAK